MDTGKRKDDYRFYEGYEGWIGFTRDYNEFINAFEDECIECAIEPEEYLKDLVLYQNQSFSYNETTDVLNCLITIMTMAKEKQICALVRVN